MISVQKHMIAIQSGDWYDESNDDKSIALAKECGIEALDFNIDHVFDPRGYVKGKEFPFCDKPLEEFVAAFAPMKAAAEKYGVAFSQFHAPFPVWFEGEPEKNEYILSVVEKTIAVCAYVNCPAIVVHPYASGNDEKDREINLQIYRRLMPAAKKYGVIICLENIFRVSSGRIVECFCSRAEDNCALIDILNAEAGEKVFGFCLDVGHANVTSRDIRAYINILGDRLTILHIHDNDGIGDKHLIPYTQTTGLWGDMPGTDWEGFLSGLRDIGYQGNLAFETFRATRHFPKELEKDALSLITAIGRYFRSRLEA